MKTIDYSEKAIQFVDKRLNEGMYNYPLFCYVPWDYWNDLLVSDTAGITTTNETNFNYARCFTYSFFEDIKLQHNFYTVEATKEVIARGYLEYFDVRISAFGPYYYIDRGKYVPDGDSLELIDISECQNQVLEAKILELKTKLDQAGQKEVDLNALRIPLKKDIPLEDYEPDEISYLSFLFE